MKTSIENAAHVVLALLIALAWYRAGYAAGRFDADMEELGRQIDRRLEAIRHGA